MDEAVIATLRPLVAGLRALQRTCRPMSADYHAIAISLAAADEAAAAITGRSGAFSAHGDASGPLRPQRG